LAALLGFFGTLAITTLAALGTMLGRFKRSLAWGLARILRLPQRVCRMARPALALALSVLACGLAVVLLAVILRGGVVLSSYQALRPGWVGGAILTLAQLLYLGNLALWAVAFMAGPGFALGLGAQINPAGSSVAEVPLIPILGALPQPGPLPLWVLAGWLLPALCAAVLAWRWIRGPAGTEPLLRQIADLATCVGLAVLALAVLLAVSGGALGPGRLGTVGPVAWQVALLLTGQLSLGAALGAWLGRR
jgi:Family of unknown function (DUF6350)